MKHRLICAASVLLAAFAFAGLSRAEEKDATEDGWIVLFNGKDLSGWRVGGPEESWKVEDGAIVANGKPSHLFTEQEFGDFDFKAEVMTRPGSNGGIYFHSKYQDTGWPATGYETQVNVTQRDPVKTGSLYNVVKLFRTPAEDDKWWTHEISVRGARVTVTINGEVQYEYVEPEGVNQDEKPRTGSFALQAHDPDSVIYYRNLRVKPVKP